MKNFQHNMSSFRAPRPGEEARFVCKKCGEGFSAKIPLLDFIACPKCPKCGSRNTQQDKRFLY